uniref:Cathepsin L n=1 Tax=Panagrolaimus superbus TaxID=310955 RepID=A0A914YBK6_9BILA
MFIASENEWRLSTNDETIDSAEDEIVEAHRSRNRQYVRTRDSLKALIRQGYDDWEAFKGVHSKRFTDNDIENERMLAFLASQQQVRRHNDAFERGDVSFKIGINHIADLPFSEYQKLNGYRRLYGDSNAQKNSSHWLSPLNADIPESLDWREHGYVTDVKNQGMCGSCWAFSATGSLEGQHKRSSGNLVSLSEQNLVDCSAKYGTQKKCHFKKATVGADDTGFVDLPAGDEEQLKVAVATQGPISVAIDAGHRSFQLYKEGVYFESQCSPEMLDHGVLVVGYGTDPKHGDYWIVKNSWGETWGESGYIRMARNKKNHCGIATKASYPLV